MAVNEPARHISTSKASGAFPEAGLVRGLLLTLCCLAIGWPCIAQHKTIMNAWNNGLDFYDAGGQKYIVTVSLSDRAAWASATGAVDMPMSKTLVCGQTVLHPIAVQEVRQYICVLPLHPGQKQIPRFGPPRLTAQFTVEGFIEGQYRSLSYSGNKWVPVAVCLYTGNELWLKVKLIRNNLPAGRMYHIRLLLPFDQ